MTNVVLAPARFPPHIQNNGPVTSSRVFGLVIWSRLSSLVCLSSVLWWSVVWSALSSPVSAAASHLI